MYRASIDTPIGTAILEGTEQGLSRFTLSEQEVTHANIPPCLEEALCQIREYFNGQRTAFSLLLDPKGTPFQRTVWKVLETIPYGTTISYADLSKKIGDPKAVRAVAAANGKNPLWIIVPCHRVIGSDGSLTGYAGGLWRKKWLLSHEQGLIQTQLF